MKVQEKLKQFQLERKAILATNFYNYETLKGILEAASRVQAPVMLQLTKSSIDYMGLKRAVVLARQGLEDYRLDGCIHLDHGGSVELVQRCLDAGFESVMIDASEKSMEENIETTCKVVEMARPRTGLMWRPNWAMCLSWDKCKIRPVLRPWKMPFVSSGLHR